MTEQELLKKVQHIVDRAIERGNQSIASAFQTQRDYFIGCILEKTPEQLKKERIFQYSSSALNGLLASTVYSHSDHMWSIEIFASEAKKLALALYDELEKEDD